MSTKSPPATFVHVAALRFLLWNFTQMLNNEVSLKYIWKWQNYAASTNITPHFSASQALSCPVVCWWLWKEPTWFCWWRDEHALQTWRWTQLLQTLELTNIGSHADSPALRKFPTALLMCSYGSSSRMVCSRDVSPWPWPWTRSRSRWPWSCVWLFSPWPCKFKGKDKDEDL